VCGANWAFLTTHARVLLAVDDVRGLEVTRILSSVKRTGLLRPSEI